MLNWTWETLPDLVLEAYRATKAKPTTYTLLTLGIGGKKCCAIGALILHNKATGLDYDDWRKKLFGLTSEDTTMSAFMTGFDSMSRSRAGVSLTTPSDWLLGDEECRAFESGQETYRRVLAEFGTIE